MSNDFMKSRTNRSLRDARGALPKRGGSGGTGGGGNSRIPDGRYDSIYLQDTPLWFHIPPQAHTYEHWDGEAGEVVTSTLPFYMYRTHGMGMGKNHRSVMCSAGPHKSQPCWGCAYLNAYGNELRAIEDEKGVRPKWEPVIGGGMQNALSVVLMENVYSVPRREANGKVKKTKSGQTIYQSVPEPLLDSSEITQLQGKGCVYGKKFHMSMSTSMLEKLFDLDEELGSYCANCATHMVITAGICEDCESQVSYPTPLSGRDVKKYKERKQQCSACHCTKFVPMYACPGCGEAAMGSLSVFDVQIRKEKVTDKANTIELVDVRVHDRSNEDINKMTDNPFNLPKVLVPESLDYQKRVFPKDLLEGLNATDGVRQAAAAEGEEGGEDEGGTDVTW